MLMLIVIVVLGFPDFRRPRSKADNDYGDDSGTPPTPRSDPTTDPLSPPSSTIHPMGTWEAGWFGPRENGQANISILTRITLTRMGAGG